MFLEHIFPQKKIFFQALYLLNSLKNICVCSTLMRYLFFLDVSLVSTILREIVTEYFFSKYLGTLTVKTSFVTLLNTFIVPRLEKFPI